MQKIRDTGDYCLNKNRIRGVRHFATKKQLGSKTNNKFQTLGTKGLNGTQKSTLTFSVNLPGVFKQRAGV